MFVHSARFSLFQLMTRDFRHIHAAVWCVYTVLLVVQPRIYLMGLDLQYPHCCLVCLHNLLAQDLPFQAIQPRMHLLTRNFRHPPAVWYTYKVLGIKPLRLPSGDPPLSIAAACQHYGITTDLMEQITPADHPGYPTVSERARGMGNSPSPPMGRGTLNVSSEQISRHFYRVGVSELERKI
jgi:hypothetical protein